MPERIPAPRSREHRTDGSEAAERLCSFFGKHEAELLDVHREDVPAVLDAGGNRLPERVVGVLKAEIDAGSDTELALVAQESMRRMAFAVSVIIDGYGIAGMVQQFGGHLVVRRCRHTLNSYDTVAFLNTGIVCGVVRQNGIHYARNPLGDERIVAFLIIAVRAFLIAFVLGELVLQREVTRTEVFAHR